MISKKTIRNENFNFEKGEVILIDKNAGVSSFYIVRRLRKILNIKKIGHAGTLDPAATGLLILCTGKKTKEISLYQNLKKCYTGSIELGKATPSMDAETEFVEENDISGVSLSDIELTRKKFVGEILQTPPMYSAIKHKGKSLYKYARKGIELKREPRKVTVYNFEIDKIELPEVYFKIECSKGTYIRVIADDFGKELGVGGYLKSLRRTKIGEYSVDDAYTIEEFENLMN